MSTSAPEKTFLVEVSQHDIHVVTQALLELPAKFAIPILNKLNAQLVAQGDGQPTAAQPARVAKPATRDATGGDADVRDEGHDEQTDRPRRKVQDEPDPVRPRTSVNGDGRGPARGFLAPDEAADALAER